MLTGTGFTTQPIPRLGVPAMGMADAGEGVRGGTRETQGPATLFPCGIAMASTWDPDLAGRIGKAIGEEAQNKGEGAHILLGPCVNIHRSPLGGRNGESLSEDPYVAAQIATGYILGMQSSGCAACVKHFACNNEEVDRGYIDVHVSERALREIYLPAFEAAVQRGHVWALMTSYNQVIGYHSSANHYLVTDVLKKGWGFDGLAMSDWGGVHETNGVINAGNDLEMPGGGFLTHDKVAAALASGAITQQSIDDSVRRILRTVIRVGLLDGPREPDHSIVNSPAHERVAYDAATEGIVLLKNAGNILPLDRNRIHSIAVIGPAAEGMQLGAAGSVGLRPFTSVQPLDGITTAAGPGIAITYAKGTEVTGPAGVPIPASALQLTGNSAGQPGLHGEYFANQNLQGAPAFTRTDNNIQFNWDKSAPSAAMARTDFSVRWTGQITAPVTGSYIFNIDADDGCRLFIDDKPIIDHWVPDNGTPQSATVDLVAGQPHTLRLEYFQAEGEAYIRLNWKIPGQDNFTEAVQAAKSSDIAVVFVTTSGSEGEGHDRPSMALPGNQDALIEAVAAANKNTIVVLNNGTPCLMPWLSDIPGLIEAWFPGEEGGQALASILFGDTDPSGKLPDTLGARREDYPDYGNFPGTKGVVNYAEGIYVGYRHFDKAQIAPLFPFGYGLSFTTFRYSDLTLSQPTLTPNGSLTATAKITDTGSRAGAEVVELYIHDPAPKIDKPLRELKGFQRVDLLPGETKTVTFNLTPQALAYCDVPHKQWRADPGLYDIEIAASSRDIRLTGHVTLTETYKKPIPGMRNASE